MFLMFSGDNIITLPTVLHDYPLLFEKYTFYSIERHINTILKETPFFLAQTLNITEFTKEERLRTTPGVEIQRYVLPKTSISEALSVPINSRRLMLFSEKSSILIFRRPLSCNNTFSMCYLKKYHCVDKLAKLNKSPWRFCAIADPF